MKWVQSGVLLGWSKNLVPLGLFVGSDWRPCWFPLLRKQITRWEFHWINLQDLSHFTWWQQIMLPGSANTQTVLWLKYERELSYFILFPKWSFSLISLSHNMIRTFDVYLRNLLSLHFVSEWDILRFLSISYPVLLLAVPRCRSVVAPPRVTSKYERRDWGSGSEERFASENTSITTKFRKHYYQEPDWNLLHARLIKEVSRTCMFGRFNFPR